MDNINNVDPKEFQSGEEEISDSELENNISILQNAINPLYIN